MGDGKGKYPYSFDARFAFRSSFKTLHAEDLPISNAPSMNPLHPSAQLQIRRKRLANRLHHLWSIRTYSAFAKMQLPSCSSSLKASR
jgi:hypothetical protein